MKFAFQKVPGSVHTCWLTFFRLTVASVLSRQSLWPSVRGNSMHTVRSFHQRTLQNELRVWDFTVWVKCSLWYVPVWYCSVQVWLCPSCSCSSLLMFAFLLLLSFIFSQSCSRLRGSWTCYCVSVLGPSDGEAAFSKSSLSYGWCGSLMSAVPSVQDAIPCGCSTLLNSNTNVLLLSSLRLQNCICVLCNRTLVSHYFRYYNDISRWKVHHTICQSNWLFRTIQKWRRQRWRTSVMIFLQKLMTNWTNMDSRAFLHQPYQSCCSK